LRSVSISSGRSPRTINLIQECLLRSRHLRCHLSSRELIDLFVERVARQLVLLVTFRPEFQLPWTGQAQVTVLVLNRLDRSWAQPSRREGEVGGISSTRRLSRRFA
jgi:hypothetical protein